LGDVKVPKIEFPCDYPIKVIGEAVPDFLEQVVAIVRTYDDTLTADRLTERDSRKGNYRSITMQVHVVSEAQLQPMFLELKAVAAVRMVL
tara:strand:+ start:168 stop:437 length:270 start_codon:yes stop_codon:yes gene_type:complete